MEKKRNEGMDAHLAMKAIELQNRPREKMLQMGARNLSNTELLAIVLGSGNSRYNALELAQKILFHFDHRMQELRRVSVLELTKFHGLGTIKAIHIIAALELGFRCRTEQEYEPMIITSSKDAYLSLRDKLSDLHYEEFWVIFLNRGNRIIRTEKISQGGVSGTVVDTKIIAKMAVECLASQLILVHNHPSGNLEASSQDKAITYKIKEACGLLDVKLLDHLIIGQGGYKSFADEGVL